MAVTRSFVLFLLVSVAMNVHSHRHHGDHPEHRRIDGRDDFERKSASAQPRASGGTRSELTRKSEKHQDTTDTNGSVPFSAKRLEKMLEKAILKIITGDLSTADMLLLKSLNYSLEEVLTIRERELGRRKDEESKKIEESKTTRKTYGEGAHGKKEKHRNHNSMEFESSSSRTEQSSVQQSRSERKKNRYKEKVYDKNFDFDAYNRQATMDYENLASKLETQQLWSEPANFDYEDESRMTKEQDPSRNIHRTFDRAMEPHVVFKIRYDDSEFDSSSGSDERSQFLGRDAVASKGPKHRASSTFGHTTARNVGNSFHASPLSPSSSSFSSPTFASSSSTGATPLPVVYQLANFKSARPDKPKSEVSSRTTKSPLSAPAPRPSGSDVVNANTASNVASGAWSTSGDNTPGRNIEPATTTRKTSEYEGLEWVEDDVYRVIPTFANSLGYDNVEENETSDYEEPSQGFFTDGRENDTMEEYQNDAPDPIKLFMASANASTENASFANLSTYQQLALAHRREGNVTSSFDSQGQRAIEDIKSRVLALTGRFNLSTNTNQVQRERLTMFSPTCQIPRNTDPEAWTDPFSMNMHFQLNLTNGDHVVAAKLRIYKLPQDNLTSPASGAYDEDEDDEKKIRISIYYYTKSLKKHRSKKRLMDSIVTPLTADGTHLALDVRQGLRFWRQASRNLHGNGSNHGLVIQVEDQDGRPMKPALYIQQPSCVDRDSDQKACTRQS